MRLLRSVVIAGLLSWLCMLEAQAAIVWPSEPHDSSQPLGNSYGEYQFYEGTAAYLHPGIDILGYPGKPVYAVKSGYVKAVLTISADLHWRVAIGDSASAAPCDGWLYAHLDPLTIAVDEGEYVTAGQYLGELVEWPVANFHHLHFVKIHNSGVTWNADWQFIQNPLEELLPITDTAAPVFYDAWPGRRFAICRDNTANYFSASDSLSGKVDIIARISDKVQQTYWEVAPYRIDYAIKSATLATDTFLSLIYTGPLYYEQNVNVTYKHDGVLNSAGDYDERKYYFIVTNTDGDSVVEAGDAAGAWDTRQIPDGGYWILVWAADKFGNVTVDSMLVHTHNSNDVSGHVLTSDGLVVGRLARIEAPLLGLTDSSDASSNFTIGPFAPGSYQLICAVQGYLQFDSIVNVVAPLNLNIALSPGPYVAGDADGSGRVNVSDAVRIINFVFAGGLPPLPYSAGDANGDGPVNVSDAVYIINYVFVHGPPPIP